MTVRYHYCFIESNTTGSGQRACEQLVRDGHHVSLISRHPEAYSFTRCIEGLRIIEAETNDELMLLDAIRELSRSNPVDALFTFSTYYVEATANVARALGKRYLNPTSANLCHHKQAMRSRLAEAGLPVPCFELLTSLPNASSVSRTFPYPCVLKPTADSGSFGVYLASTCEDFLAHYRRLAERETNLRGQRVCSGILVEEYLEGPEYSVETFTFQSGSTGVIGVTQKHVSKLPYFVECGHDFPAPVEPDVALQLANSAIAALDAVGFDFGPAHTEVKMTAKGPVVVEINPRLAGGMIPELIRYSTGIDLIAQALRAVVGLELDLTGRKQEHSAIRFLIAGAPSFLRSPMVSLSRGDAVRSGLAPPQGRFVNCLFRYPCIKEIIVEPHNKAVARATSSSDRFGFVIASGTCRHEVVAAAENVQRDVLQQILFPL